MTGSFLLDAPLLPSGLFGNAVCAIVDRQQEARKQAAAFHRFLPRRSLAQGAAGQEQPLPHASSSYREAQKESVTGRASLETTAKCVSVGPAHCRERLQNPRFSSASIQWVVPTLVMDREVDTLLRKEAIEVVPPHEREYGFYSWYFIVTKKDRGLDPILDLHQLKRSVSRLKFKMLTLKQVVYQIRSKDWFVTIDLKDAYFHVSILPTHREFLRFAFRDEAYQYRVLPFGLALSPALLQSVWMPH